MKYEFTSKLDNGDKSTSTLTILSNDKVDLSKELAGEPSTEKVATLSKDSIKKIMSKISKVSDTAPLTNSGEVIENCKQNVSSTCSIIRDGQQIEISRLNNCHYMLIEDADGANLEEIIEGLNKINQ